MESVIGSWAPQVVKVHYEWVISRIRLLRGNKINRRIDCIEIETISQIPGCRSKDRSIPSLHEPFSSAWWYNSNWSLAYISDRCCLSGCQPLVLLWNRCCYSKYQYEQHDTVYLLKVVPQHSIRRSGITSRDLTPIFDSLQITTAWSRISRSSAWLSPAKEFSDFVRNLAEDWKLHSARSTIPCLITGP